MRTPSTESDHDKIRHWIEERGGHPARAKNDKKHETIRVDFDDSEATTEVVSWDEFFQAFDDSRRKFLHKEDADRFH